jgi:nicotinamidase-related amidase
VTIASVRAIYSRENLDVTRLGNPFFGILQVSDGLSLALVISRWRAQIGLIAVSSPGTCPRFLAPCQSHRKLSIARAVFAGETNQNPGAIYCMTSLDPRITALVLVDLQNGIVGMPLSPRAGSEVVSICIDLAEHFREAGAPVVLVNVAWAKDFGDALRQPVDKPFTRPEGGFPEGWSDLVDGLAKSSDILVTKHQWGAFYGTDLDVKLRRRAIRTIVLGGIATNMGVESTARQAWEHGYGVVIVEDAATSFSAEMHAFSVGEILPRIARVVKAADIAFRKGS